MRARDAGRKRDRFACRLTAPVRTPERLRKLLVTSYKNMLKRPNNGNPV